MTYNFLKDDVDRMFYDRATWELKFALWPVRCDKSKKIIWLKHAYQGYCWYSGPGEPIPEIRWLSTKSYLFESIKGTIKGD